MRFIQKISVGNTDYVSSRRKFAKMAVWSSLASKNIGKLGIARRLLGSLTKGCKKNGVNYMPVRNSHEKTIAIRDTTYPAFKFKDMLYFYLTIGALPVLAIILYANIFIGPATLALIPEGYEPEPWEYYRHPITRFMAKYITPSKQEHYERTLHSIFFTSEKQMLQQLERKVQKCIKEKEDYQAWYFYKPTTKYARKMNEFSEESEQRAGRSGGWIL